MIFKKYLLLPILGSIFAAIILYLISPNEIMGRWIHLIGRDAQILNVSAERLHDIPVLVPKDDPIGLTILVSDAGGLTDKDRAFADALLKRNIIVLPVNLDIWRQELNKEDGECIYLNSDFEAIVHVALRALDLDVYFHPIIAGIGQGGTLAYVAAADAPYATLGGAVALDPVNVLKTKLPSCEGAKATHTLDGGYSYILDAVLPTPATLISAAGPVNDPIDARKRNIAILQSAPDAQSRMNMAVDAIATMATNDAENESLPIIDIPAKETAQFVAVFFSGDGGWRDIDKSIGGWLADHGVHVVGVDSLRYFWSERTPEEIADDTNVILKKADPTGKLPVAILGFSFGADVFPFAWQHLDFATQEKIRMVALLAPAMKTSFQITVDGWLNGGGDKDIVPALATIPLDRLICIYGAEEEDSSCMDPRLVAIKTIKFPGGHHFDENYESIADRLLQGLKDRANKKSEDTSRVH